MSLRYILDNAWRVLMGKVHLRRCNSVGARPRVYSRPRIVNMGEIRIGNRFIMFNHVVPCELGTHPGGKIEIGDGVFLNYGCSLSAHDLVKIGDKCQIGSYACMMDNDYHQVDDREKPGESAPIVLERNVWLGVRVVILKGVTIGENSVIGAGSVVSRSIPPNCLAAGVPAKVIRTFDPSAAEERP